MGKVNNITKAILKSYFRSNYFHFLLFSLLMMTVISSFMLRNKPCLFLFDITYVSILVISTAAAFKSKWRSIWILTGLFLATVILRILNMVMNDHILNWSYHFSVMLILFISFMLIMYSVMNAKKIDSNIISGAVCGYFIIGIICASVYVAIELFNPGSFKFENLDVSRISLDELADEFFYYSITTLTSLGQNDILPVSRLVRHLTALESVAGQIYLAIIIARLVAIHTSQKSHLYQRGENDL